MTLATLVREASAALHEAGLTAHDASFDAVVLARHLGGWDAAEWLVRQRDAASGAFEAAFAAAIARRRRREPVAYITGVREFYGRTFRVSHDVLIPRPETELVVDEALRSLADRVHPARRRPSVVDVGTGSGCLAITIALERPDADVAATDVSAAALGVAARNADALGAPRVSFRQDALLAGLAGCDLVVSNPPYVPEPDRPNLEPEVRDYEPAVALFAGADGLDVIRQLVPAAAAALASGGALVMEIGAGQSADVTRMALETGAFADVRMVPDLAGIPRVLVARTHATSL